MILEGTTASKVVVPDLVLTLEQQRVFVIFSHADFSRSIDAIRAHTSIFVYFFFWPVLTPYN